MSKDLKIKKILIIDDDEVFQMYLTKLLETEHPKVQVIRAYNGQEAADLLQNMDTKPDLIFLDINMPVMNGVDFLKIRKAFLKLHNIRVIIVTSTDVERDKEKLTQFDFVEDYIIKSVLDESLKKHLK